VGHVGKKGMNIEKEKRKKEQIKLKKRNEKKENWGKQQDLNMRAEMNTV